MNGQVAGMIVGAVIAALALWGFWSGVSGFQAGQQDVGFWYTVMGAFLLLAAGAVIVGTRIHTRGGGA